MLEPEVRNDIEELFWKLENIVRRNSDAIRFIKPKLKSLVAIATNLNRVDKLQKVWADTPSEVLTELSTQQSVPFVTVMLGLAERKYKVAQVSMVTWWRRMCATGQDCVLTYFSWKRLSETFSGTTVAASDIMRVCIDNEETLGRITSALSDDKCVDFKIRELLGGLSMQSDVNKAWRDWAKVNHPDKGGDAETFLRVKLVYDEWCEIQKKQPKQST